MTVTGFIGHLARHAGLAAFGLVAIAVELAPIGGASGAVSAPDALTCLLLAAAARRPDAAPAPLVFALGLLRDILCGGPVGAGALVLMLSVEAMRRIGPTLRAPRMLGALAASAALVALGLLAQRLLLGIVFAPAPPLSDLVMRAVATVALWPVIAIGLAAAPAIGPGRRDRAGVRE